MCIPKQEKLKTIAPLANQAPEIAPKAVEVVSDSAAVKSKGRKDLRIDLASSPPQSGVNV